MANFQVNKLYFLVSEEKDNYVQELFLSVRHICDREKITCEYVDINSQSDFRNALNSIKEECINNQIKPYIHLACHGSSQGLHLKSTGKIHWNIFADLLTGINIACRNNLFISLASCYGGYLTLPLIDKAANGHKSRAPVFGLIGPVDEIKHGEIETGFLKYFEAIFESKNIDEGVKCLNKNLKTSNGYMYNSCKEIYKELIERFLKSDLERKFKNKLTFNNHLSELIRQRFLTTGRLSNTEDIETLAKIVSSEKFYVDYFNTLRTHFFMIDLYSENEIRFEKVGGIENWNYYLSNFF